MNKYQTLKQKAPNIFSRFFELRKRDDEIQLQILRDKYKTATEEERYQIKRVADRIKSDLNELSDLQRGTA
jgi:hypothetical protein